MMKKTLLIYLLIVAFKIAFTQSAYVKKADISFISNSLVNYSPIINGGNIIFYQVKILVGGMKEYYITKIDTAFNHIYSKKIDFPTLKNQAQNAFLENVNVNRFVMCNVDSSINNTKILTRLSFINNINCNFIWTKTIDSLTCTSVKFHDNKITVFGRNGNRQCYINFDTLGNIINSKTFNTSYIIGSTWPQQVNFLQTNGIIGADSSYYLLSHSGNSEGCKITKFDKYNNFEWCYAYKFPGTYASQARDLAPSKDGGLFFRDMHHGCLIKLNKNGAISWYKSFGYTNFYINIFENSKKEIICSIDNALYVGEFYIVDSSGTNVSLKYSKTCIASTGFGINLNAYGPDYFFRSGVISNSPWCNYTGTVNCTAERDDYSFNTCAYYNGTLTINNHIPQKGDSTFNLSSFSPVINSIIPNITPVNFSPTILQTHCNVVGIKEAMNSSDFQIYPNPTDNFILLKSTDNTDYKIELINNISQICKTETISSDSQKITVSNLSKGVYFIKIYSSGGKLLKVSKILIE